MKFCLVYAALIVVTACNDVPIKTFQEWSQGDQSDFFDIVPKTLDLYRFPKKDCTGTIHVMTDEERNHVVDIHNGLRRQVANGHEKRGRLGPHNQPNAADMAEMKYDTDLEIVAMVYLLQCFRVHEISNIGNIAYPVALGQNIYHSESAVETPTIDWDKIIKEDWYGQGLKDVNNFDVKGFSRGNKPKANVGNKPKPEGGSSYAEIVNPRATRIGCSTATYNRGFVRPYNYVVLCYYKPGVVQGQPLYQIGTCSGKNCEDGLLKSDAAPLESDIGLPTPEPNSQKKKDFFAQLKLL